MDPDACLQEIRKIVARINEYCDDDLPIPTEDSIELKEKVQALDGWMRGGGFLPEDWVTHRGNALT